MLKLGLVQVNFQAGPVNLNAFYLPYTVGILWAYARQNKTVADNYQVHYWGFRRDPIDQQAKAVAECDVAFFSFYVWNKNYTFTLIQKAKEINPDLIVIVGGPEVPHTRESFYLEHPEIDSVIIGEGEVATEEILEKIANGESLPKKHSVPRLRELLVPSPYLEGIFDDLMDAHTDIEWMPTLETDRGCPYKCTFCDWGSATNSKVVKFGLDRIFAELEWVGKKGLPFLTLTNANFGIFKERDNLITDKIIEVKEQHSVPTAVSVSYAKNSNADVFNIIKKFQQNGIGSGYSLSLQSTTEQVLENIERKNMKVNNIKELTDLANTNQTPLYTELIMGLPGETKESFKDCIYTVIDHGLHNGFDAFFLIAIENAPIQKQIEEFGIKTFDAYDFFYNATVAEDDDFYPKELNVNKNIDEVVPTVLETKDMPYEDLKETYKFIWYMTGLHITGITDIISRFLVKSGICTYKEFYDILLQRIRNQSIFKEWEDKFDRNHDEWTTTGISKLRTKSMQFAGWQNQYSLMVFIQDHDVLDLTLNIVCDLVHYYFNVDERVVADYKHLTYNRIKQFKNYCFNEKNINTFTNVWDFINDNDDEIVFESRDYTVKDRWNRFPDTEKDHFDNILFARRRYYGLNVIDR